MEKKNQTAAHPQRRHHHGTIHGLTHWLLRKVHRLKAEGSSRAFPGDMTFQKEV